MDITITINTPDLSDAINNLAASIAAKSQMQIGNASEPNAPEKKDMEKDMEKAETATPTEASVPMPTSKPVSMPEPEPAKPIDLNTLCESGARLVEQGKMEQVINLLGKYGVQAINQLAESNYEAFAADLRALGAQI